MQRVLGVFHRCCASTVVVVVVAVAVFCYLAFAVDRSSLIAVICYA